MRRSPDATFMIVERRADLGGTWDFFRYPGVRSDSDMWTFGFGFKPWSSPVAIAEGDDIIRYLRETVSEFGLEPCIRFNHDVASLSWSSPAGRWTAEVTGPGRAAVTIKARFVHMCSGYYQYESPYKPTWPGIEQFAGAVVHPQNWDDSVDYDGKRVIVIGSGATAVTLVPALAKRAAHVTMLQRTPSYIVPVPGPGETALLERVLPGWIFYPMNRWFHICRFYWYYTLMRALPGWSAAALKKMARERVDPAAMSQAEFDHHFSPPYKPWDQRLCATPGGEFFDAINTGAISIVTDHIDRFTSAGIRTRSGRLLEADLVVTATGMKLQENFPMSTITVSVDGA